MIEKIIDFKERSRRIDSKSIHNPILMEIDSALAQTQKRSPTFVDGDEGRVVMTNADYLPEIEIRRKDKLPNCSWKGNS